MERLQYFGLWIALGGHVGYVEQFNSSTCVVSSFDEEGWGYFGEIDFWSGGFSNPQTRREARPEVSPERRTANY